ncbi:tubulin-folding cofactor B-like [Argiope bruennichi]|uniref:Tubulin-folding cofactor B like protein n=1 Tax=Argiope bruennichi TaxID=94029 RepID=A0A8T0F909_ARGBR|nr:tubulin-folding cofactor B-like [Argiope bruennichi]XP_055941592.1 tubulin-folding cofactor B-like [Argiope bruennichi]XP_055941594.1 tubulin-folding cofactor B-like [Argiope bruennichi]XP_055941595.1 tubulin-folding cofactor B-like [Argiope bruennichi]KAF8786798.1 Tubulin-folding cofactor B like protein [Argiope bruennichi]
MGEENKNVLDILVTSTIISFGTQRRFPTKLTIGELKQKLELITGGSASSMELQLLDDKNEVIAKLNDNSAVLSSYPLDNAKVLHVIDSSIQAGEFEDLSKVKKFELSEEEYAKRGETLRAFKEKLKLQSDEQKESFAEKKQKEEEDLIKNMSVGNRCEVRIAGKPTRRGTVMYIGKTEFKPGFWIGVKYDEPVGKNDGSVSGKRYFECVQKYGGFVKPHDVVVGDFPEETYDLDEI